MSLTAGFENLARSMIMVEKDEDIGAVWRTVLGGEAKWLAEQIMNFEMSPDSIKAMLTERPTSLRQRAFITILKNRLHHGGILAQRGRGLDHGNYVSFILQNVCTGYANTESYNFFQLFVL